MGRNASAGIVTATLNQTATDGSPVYFSYDSGTIGTLDYSSVNTSISGSVLAPPPFGPPMPPQLLVGGYVPYSQVANLSPLSFGTVNSDTTAWTGGVNVDSDGYFGVRFSAGGSDYNYGWVSVTKTASSLTFGEASVETTINTPIAAGAVAPTSSVPEIDPATGGSALSLVACVLAMIEQRRRRRGLATGLTA